MTIFKKDLSKRMKKEAISLGLCEKWQREWADKSSKDEMAEKFVRGIDFCIKHDWPSPKFIKKNFGDVMHMHGVYADENFITNSPTVILWGSCDGEVIANRDEAKTVYVKHNSKLKVYAGAGSVVFVSIYDNAMLEVTCDLTAKVFVYKYGGSVKYTKGYPVKIRPRNINI